MSFWNDPSQNATKSILFIAIVAIVGVGIYQLAGNDTSLTGNVYRGTKKAQQEQTVYVNVSHNNDGSCVIHTCAEGITAPGELACVDYVGETTLTDGEKLCSVDDTSLTSFGASKQVSEE